MGHVSPIGGVQLLGDVLQPVGWAYSSKSRCVDLDIREIHQVDYNGSISTAEGYEI